MILTPAFTSPGELPVLLRRQGYAALAPPAVCELTGCTMAHLQALVPSWNDLPHDAWLKDGGHYRRRRHSCFVVAGKEVTQAPHRAHWQPVEYIELHGGMQRWFEPIAPDVVQAPAWQVVLSAVAKVCSLL
jgi:hypothetical protein